MMKEDTFGIFLREKRQQCGLSQYQLGVLLKVSDKAVSKWENGLARPKSQLLYRLSVILGVTVDELLAGGRPGCKSCSIKERHGYLWEKAYSNLMERYADMPPIEAISRFEMEKLAIRNTDMILFFDLLSQIAESASGKGYPVRQEGGIGASFVAYLLGVSDINPLSAHYYCPVCRRVEFVPQVMDGWELDRKYCDSCHSPLMREGHNLPFEVYRHVIGNRNAGFDLVISRRVYEEAEERILRYFGSNRILVLNPPPEVTKNRGISKMLTYAIQPRDGFPAQKDSALCSYGEYYNYISDKPYINLIFKEDYEKYMELGRMVDLSGTEIDLWDRQVQQALFKGDVDEIPDFGLRDLRQLLKKNPAKNMEDVLRLYGIALCASALSENESEWYLSPQVNISEVIPYRDDVFLHICSKMEEHGYLEKGFAFRVMDQTRRGLYRRNGVDRHIRKLLLDIGVSERYISHLEETAYLFPKAQAIAQVRDTLILLWYRMHYPKEFRHVMEENIDDFERKRWRESS